MSIEYCPICRKCVNIKETLINLDKKDTYTIKKQCTKCNTTISNLLKIRPNN